MSFKDAIKKVTATHVKRALAEIDRHNIPRNRRSTKWGLRIGTRYYPPKYVLSLAVKIASRQTLAPSDHSGGERTNAVLRALGFEIVASPNGSSVPEE
jgi:hypothetical protein